MAACLTLRPHSLKKQQNAGTGASSSWQARSTAAVSRQRSFPIRILPASDTASVRGEDGSRHFLERRLQAEQARTESARKEEDTWTSLARFTIENFVQGGVIPAVSGNAAICGAVKHPIPDALLSESAGVFVSIHEHGELRGCIGTILPTRKNIAEEIIQNAVSACSEDPRFSPVTQRELPYLELSVDVLGKPENIKGPEELDVHRCHCQQRCPARAPAP